jgi:O-antigen/teichoic acid export membrane protein
VLIRECFDFPMALKVIDKTRYFLYGDVAAIILNLSLLVSLVPTFGLLGVTAAYVISSSLQCLYLGWCTTRFYHIPARQFIPWTEISKVALAAALPLALTYGTYFTDHLSLFGVIVGSMMYLSVYALLLFAFRVAEAHAILKLVRERLVIYIPSLRT